MLDLCWIRERPRKRTLGRASEVESSGRPQVMSRGRCCVIGCADCFSLVWRLLALCALQIYDLFTKVLDRLKHDKDAQGVGYLEQAVELWTSMMIEEHEHDDWCLNNIHDMQEECEAWLLELQSELDAKDGGEASAAIVTKPTAARATRSAPPPPVSPASSPSNPSEKPVTMTMKLGMDFAKAGKECSPERAKFEQQLVADLAAASGEDPSTFKITKLSPGSVVVETEISKSASGKGADPIQVAKTLHKQAEDPNSPLRKGKLTSAVEDIAVPQEQLEEHTELVRLRAELAQVCQKEPYMDHKRAL